MTDHVKDVCKIGQGHDCCRYLVVAPGGFECGKLEPPVKYVLDRRVRNEQITARGDNCEGKEVGDLNQKSDE